MKNRSETPALRSKWPRRVAALIILLLVAALLIVGGGFLFVRFGLEGKQVVSIITGGIESSTGKSVSFSSADLEWLSLDSARISVSNLEVRDNPESKPNLSVPKIDLRVSLMPLLKGTLHFDYITVDNPTLVVPRPSMFHPREKMAPPPAPKVYPVVKRLEIRDGRIVLGESGGENSPIKTYFSDVTVTADDLTPGGAEEFQVTGKAVSYNRTGSFSINGKVDSTPVLDSEWKGRVITTISDFPVSVLIGFIADLNIDIPVSEGLVNATVDLNGSSRQFAANGEITLSNGILLPGKLFTNPAPVNRASARFSAQRDGDTLTIQVPGISIPGMSLSVEIKISELSSERPVVSVSVKKADLDLQKLFPFIPQKLLNEEDRDRLIEAGLSGHLRILGGAWEGRLADLTNLQSAGTALLLDAYADRISGFIPGFGLPLTNATGRIRLSNDEILFNGISLTLGTSPIVLNGFIAELSRSARADLFVSMNAQAQDLRPLLEYRPVAENISPWISKISDFHGGLSITLDIKGSLKNPSLKGRLVLEEFQCRVAGLALPLRKINGSLRFRGTGASFAGMKGVIGDSQVEISGSFSPEEMSVTGDVKLLPSDFKKLGLFPADWSISGIIPATLSVKGKNASANFSSAIDLKSNSFVIGKYLRKNPGTPLTIEASGSVNRDGVTVEDAYLILDNIRISAKANVDYEGGFTVFVNLPPKGIPTSALVPVADPSLEIQPGGRVEGDLIIRGGPERSRDNGIEANILMNYVSMHLPFFYKRTEGLTGSYRRKGKSLNFSIERAKIGSSLLSGTVAISDLDYPKLDINLESSFLDTTDFTAPPGHVSTTTWGEWLKTNRFIRFLSRSKGTGSLKIAKGKTSTRVFSDFRASLEGGGGFIKATSWAMYFAEGLMKGTADFDLRENAAIPLKLEFQGDQLRIERAMPTEEDKLWIGGEMLVDGKMEWKLSPKRENNGVFKTGTIDVRLQEGSIRKFEVLSKIFSLINLGSLIRGRFPDLVSQGLPYHKMTWEMDVFDSKWKIKNLKLTSDAARIDASGMYFGDQHRVDFKVDVSPLVGFDTIVSGLFGNLITKNGKILTTTFRVRGHYEAPDVRLEPFEQFRSEQ